jgi:hypothetical protein
VFPLEPNLSTALPMRGVSQPLPDLVLEGLWPSGRPAAFPPFRGCWSRCSPDALDGGLQEHIRRQAHHRPRGVSDDLGHPTRHSDPLASAVEDLPKSQGLSRRPGSLGALSLLQHCRARLDHGALQDRVVPDVLEQSLPLEVATQLGPLESPLPSLVGHTLDDPLGRCIEVDPNSLPLEPLPELGQSRPSLESLAHLNLEPHSLRGPPRLERLLEFSAVRRPLPPEALVPGLELSEPEVSLDDPGDLLDLEMVQSLPAHQAPVKADPRRYDVDVVIPLVLVPHGHPLGAPIPHVPEEPPGDLIEPLGGEAAVLRCEVE